MQGCGLGRPPSKGSRGILLLLSGSLRNVRDPFKRALQTPYHGIRVANADEWGAPPAKCSACRRASSTLKCSEHNLAPRGSGRDWNAGTLCRGVGWEGHPVKAPEEFYYYFRALLGTFVILLSGRYKRRTMASALQTRTSGGPLRQNAPHAEGLALR